MIQSTIAQAAEMFGVPVAAICRGSRKCRKTVAAREWVIGQFPWMGVTELGRALNVNHSTVVLARRRIDARLEAEGSPWLMDVSAYAEIRKRKAVG